MTILVHKIILDLIAVNYRRFFWLFFLAISYLISVTINTQIITRESNSGIASLMAKICRFFHLRNAFCVKIM